MNASPPFQLPDDIKLAVESFFFGLNFHDRPVTVEECIRELRATDLQTDLTDETLEVIIARFAIERGFAVDFDEGGLILPRDLSSRHLTRMLQQSTYPGTS